MEFPRLVFKKVGKEVKHVSVEDEAQFDAHIKDGWFENVPDALDGVATIKDLAPTRAEMETKAKELGIKFDGRTTDKKLGEMIAGALK